MILKNGLWRQRSLLAKDYEHACRHNLCFLWKTTIGEAYDTLFMLIFISFIILFASAFFWPRARRQEKIEPPTETAVKKTE